MKSHNPTLQCTQCGKRFSRKSELHRHMVKYKEHAKIPCDICSHKFCDKLTLMRHRETVHDMKTIKKKKTQENDSCICEQCGLVCPGPNKLQKHKLSHKRPSLETCPSCLKVFRKTRLATHKCVKLKGDIQEKVVVPTDLAAKKAFYQTYIVKTTNAVSGKNILCTLCQKYFATKKFAINHLRRVHCHDDQKDWMCNICHKSFTRGRALTLHMHYHTDSRPYRCRICSRSYRQVGHVKEHLQNHWKMTIVCRYCPLKFKTRMSLMRHIEIHCQVFPYFCMMKTCERAFKSIELMTAHFVECLRLTSDGNVDIVCKLCNTSFSHTEESLTHIVKHNTEELLFYKCEGCSLKFATYQKLYVHMEENDHFNNLTAAANQKSGENCVPGTANEGEPMEQQAARYFKMEEVHLDLPDILNMYDYIPDEDAPVKVDMVNEAKTEMDIVKDYYEEVIEETNHTEHVENVAGASNLMLFTKQLTSLSSGDDSDGIDSNESISTTVRKDHQETLKEKIGGVWSGTCVGNGNLETINENNIANGRKVSVKETAVEETVTKLLKKSDNVKTEPHFSDDVGVKHIQSIKESPRVNNNNVLVIEGEKVTHKDEGNIEEVEEDLEDIDKVDEYTELEELWDCSSTDSGSISRTVSRKVKPRQSKKRRKQGKQRSQKMYENAVFEETIAERKVWLDIAVRCTTGECGEVVLGFKNFAKHKLNKHEEQLRYNCSACDKGKSQGFLSRQTLKDHFLICHSYLNCVKLSFKDAEITDSTPDIYHCTKCLFMTQDQPFRIDHNCSRVGLKYFCPYCVKNTFESYTQCETHLKSEHADKVDCASTYRYNYKCLKTTACDPASYVKEGDIQCVTCKTTCRDTKQLEIHVNHKHATHPYCCGLCRLTYVRLATLNRHMKSHNPTLQCTQCCKRFSRKSELERHMAKYKDQTKIPCDICSHKFCDKVALKRHRETTHDIKTIKKYKEQESNSCICEHCGLVCPGPKKLQTHLLSHNHPSSLETCQHCFQVLRQSHLATHKCAKVKGDIQDVLQKVVVPTDLAAKKAFYQTYIMRTTNEVNGKNIMCTLCQKHFATKKLANNHLRRVHCPNDQKGWMCNICHKGFTRGRALSLHMRYHTDSRPYRCRICSRSYRQVGHVKEHLRNHWKMTIVCHYCPLKFKTRRCLMGHIESHCQVFPYSCMVKTCEKAFKSVELMTAHFIECLRLTSSGNVDIVCKLCNISFSHSEDSLTHIVKHNTEELLFYKCERCSLKFATYQKLYVHMEENDHFNNLPAVPNQKSGENCVPGTAIEGESTEQQTTRYFKMEEVDMDLAVILNMYDYIPDEDDPVEMGVGKGDEAETELSIVKDYFEEVIEEPNHTEHVEDVAGASNLMQFAEQSTSLASGEAIDCKDPVEANYMTNKKGVNRLSDGRKRSSKLNLSKSSQNSAYPVVKVMTPEKLSEAEYTIDALEDEQNDEDATKLLTQSLGLHNYSVLHREKHVTRKLVDSLGNEVRLINDQGMPIDVNDLGDIDALDLGFTIVEVTDHEIEDKDATRA